MSDDRLELEALRVQLYDAIKDSQLWGHCDPSSEERLHIGRMQIVLNSWLGCVERRINGYERRDEDRHCDEHPSQFLHFYKKASEVRGGAIGKHLGRLAEKVEVAGTPAPKLVKTRPIGGVTQAPRPLQPLRRSWIPSRPKPAEVPTSFPPNFPSSLRPETSVILAEIVKQFLDRSKLERLCRAIVSGLTILLCKAVREGILKGHTAPDQLDELRLGPRLPANLG